MYIFMCIYIYINKYIYIYIHTYMLFSWEYSKHSIDGLGYWVLNVRQYVVPDVMLTFIFQFPVLSLIG